MLTLKGPPFTFGFMNKDRELGKVTMSELLTVYSDSLFKKRGMKLAERLIRRILGNDSSAFYTFNRQGLFVEVFRS